jgi:hypothetical protein
LRNLSDVLRQRIRQIFRYQLTSDSAFPYRLCLRFCDKYRLLYSRLSLRYTSYLQRHWPTSFFHP